MSFKKFKSPKHGLTLSLSSPSSSLISCTTGQDDHSCTSKQYTMETTCASVFRVPLGCGEHQQNSGRGRMHYDMYTYSKSTTRLSLCGSVRRDHTCSKEVRSSGKGAGRVRACSVTLVKADFKYHRSSTESNYRWSDPSYCL